MINIPLALIGGVLILKVGSNELNIPAIIGFISLLGITTRNGMLLMSRYNHLKQEGMPLLDRIYRGSVDRLLPIIMTALQMFCCIVSDIPENLETAEGHSISFVNKDVMSLQKAIEFAYYNPDIVYQYGKDARKYVIENHQLVSIVNQIEEMYVDILNKGKKQVKKILSQ